MDNRNQFDVAFGYYDDDQLSGWFSKLKKKIKKVVKKIDSKILPDKLEKFKNKVKKSKIVKVAAAAAAIYFTGGAALTAVKAGAAKLAASGAGKALITGAKLVGSGAAKVATSSVTSNLIKTGIQMSMQSKAAQMGVPITNAMEYNPNAQTLPVTGTAQYAAELAQMANDPRYASVLNQMRADGYTDAQIAEAWIKSKTAGELVAPKVAQAIYPKVYSAVSQAGATPQEAQEYATYESAKFADKATTDAQKSIDMKTILLVGVPIILALMNQNS